MANEFKIKKGLIVEGASGGTVVNVLGSQGQLLSVTDDLSGSIFAVSDISGVPIFDVNSSGLSTFDGDVNLPDNKKILLGTGNDLQIYHDGSHSYINDAATGALKILASQFEINNAANTENIATFTQNGAVSLFFNNAQKLATTSTGVSVTGSLVVSNDITATGDLSVRDIAARDATLSGQGFSSATSSGDGSSTLTTKGYVDSLITGATIYRGTWDPDVSLNSGYGNPNLNTVTKTSGYYYICSDIGTAHPNGTTGSPAVPCEPNSWEVGDWVVWNDDVPDCAGTGTGAWQKIDNTSVLSGVGTGSTVALWEGDSSVTDSETLGNAPITVSGNNSTFAGNVLAEGSLITRSVNANVTISGDTSGNIYYNNASGEHRWRANGSSVNSMNLSSTLLTVNENATFAGTVTAPTFLGDLNGTINTATTGTTQTAGNNSTLIATTAYADAAAGAVPIGNYLPLAGGTLTGALAGTSASFTGALSSVGYSGTSGTFSASVTASGNSNTFGNTTVTSNLTTNGVFTIQNASPYIQWKNVAGTRLSYIQHNATNLVMSADTGQIQLDTAANNDILINPGGTGKVGIGNTNPQAKLHIGASLNSMPANTSIAMNGGTTLRFTGGGDGNSDYGAYIAGVTVGSIRTLQLGSRNLSTDELAMTLSQGKVGIGTTTPSAKLDIQGTQGQLFSVTDNLSGSIFAVADISGVPIFDVNSSGLSTFDGNVTIKNGKKIFFNNPINTASGSIVCPGGGSLVLQAYGNDMIYLNENSEIRFSTSSSEKMRITSDGKVGIGTTNPIQKLHLDGNNYNTATRTTFLIRDVGNNYNQGDNAIDIVMRSRYWSGDQNTSQNSKIRHLKDNSNGSTGTQLRFSTTTRGAGDSSDKMTILASGNVGIGVTNPAYKLVVYETGTATSNIAIDARATGAGTNNYAVWAQGSGASSTNFAFYGAAGKNAFLGDTGIGTDNPGAKLEVAGNVIIETTGVTDNLLLTSADTSASSAPDIVMYRTAAIADSDTLGVLEYRGKNGMVPSSGTPLTYSALYSRIVDASANQSMLSINTNKGNGTGAFTQAVHIAAIGTNNSATGAILINPSSDFELPAYNLDVYGTASISSTLRVGSTVTATNFILSSDEILKDNIKNIDNKHIDVDWKNFELKSEPGVKRSGVIAQELENKHPEFVRTDKEGLKSVAYIDLLIAKIAELEARLEKAGI